MNSQVPKFHTQSAPPPPYHQICTTEHTPLLPSPIRFHSPQSSSPLFLRLFSYCALGFALISAVFLSLAVSYPSIFSPNFFFLAHSAAFEIPIAHVILATQIVHLSLVALNPSFSPFFPFTMASRAVDLVQYSVILQLATILLTRQLRGQESGLTMLSCLLLLCFGHLASNCLSAPPTSSRSNLLIRFPHRSSTGSSISIWLVNLHPPSEAFVSGLKRFRSLFYVYFLAFNALLLTISVLFKAQEADVPSRQLHNVQARLGSGALLVSTTLQSSCSYLNHPHRPSATRTILHFSPSGQTAAQSSQWISSLSGSHTTATRLCVFDRPGYNHSFNLPLSLVSDSVTVLEAVLEKTGEFKQLSAHRNSGFVLVGHGYGALEAQIFASRHPSLIRSVLLVDPETETSFFRHDVNPRDLDNVLLSVWRNFYKIASSIWTYTLNRTLVQLKLALPSGSSALTRALLQEDFLARSSKSYENFVATLKTYPTHLPLKTVFTDHEEDWAEALSQLAEI